MRTMTAVLCGLIGIAFAPAVFADAKENTVVQTITIDASPDVVWEVAGDFVGLDRWYPFIVSSRRVLGTNRQVGCIRELTRSNGTKVSCIRELTRSNGTKVEEKLIDYNPWKYTLTYTYAGGQPLTSDYFATLTIKDAGAGKSLVEWKARFKRLSYWTDEAPPGQEDATLVKLLTGAYQKGLENLKRVVEGSAF